MAMAKVMALRQVSWLTSEANERLYAMQWKRRAAKVQANTALQWDAPQAARP